MLVFSSSLSRYSTSLSLPSPPELSGGSVVEMLSSERRLDYSCLFLRLSSIIANFSAESSRLTVSLLNLTLVFSSFLLRCSAKQSLISLPEVS
jgi:hypothetical protein